MDARPAFDDIYMELAVNLAKRSHCIKRHVGAVLAKDTRIISIGYTVHPVEPITAMKNGLRRVARATQKEAALWLFMRNRMRFLYAVRNKTSVDGATLYVTLSPCLACARIIYSMGILRVIYFNSYAEHKGLAKDEGVEFLKTFGVECHKYEGKLDNVTHMI